MLRIFIQHWEFFVYRLLETLIVYYIMKGQYYHAKQNEPMKENGRLALEEYIHAQNAEDRAENLFAYTAVLYMFVVSFDTIFHWGLSHPFIEGYSFIAYILKALKWLYKILY